MPRKQTAPSGAVARLDRLYEFDREPVSPDKLCGGGYFAGSFAGEHVAATEFVIGALFVNWGATVKDVIVGLALGNILAVLSWALVCAPIAVETRLTLYWYLRKIGGPVLALIYNVLNAILFCILAGCMITVSASAVRIPFGIPAQTDWYPSDLRFVLVVLLVGAVVVTLAILGFKKLAAFAGVCAPWMLAMFLAGFLVMLPPLGKAAGIWPVDGLSRFWELGARAVWTGRTPSGGGPEISFWQVAAFAWICNLAMHLGLSDMALFRFARKSAYGYYSACGMFLGHYLAWIFAGVMGAGAALALNTPLTALDSGAVACATLGAAGAVAVVIAGWTTSNPTLYRAGLALQAVTPNWPRWLVTLVAGALTTAIACFPFVFTRLLDFVGIYGLLLSPAGAVVVTEHWVFPRIGLRRCWAGEKGLLLNKPALLAWAAGIATALVLWKTGALHLFFLFAPAWVATTLVYIVLAARGGARPAGREGAAAVPGNGAGPPLSSGREGEAVPPGAGVEKAAAARLPRAKPAAVPPGAGSTAPAGAPGVGKRGRGGIASLLTGPVAGLVALTALAACVVLPLLVSLAGTRDYAAHLARFKAWLILPTLLYFAAATVWRTCRNKEGACPP